MVRRYCHACEDRCRGVLCLPCYEAADSSAKTRWAAANHTVIVTTTSAMARHYCHVCEDRCQDVLCRPCLEAAEASAKARWLAANADTITTPFWQQWFLVASRQQWLVAAASWLPCQGHPQRVRTVTAQHLG